MGGGAAAAGPAAAVIKVCRPTTRSWHSPRTHSARYTETPTAWPQRLCFWAAMPTALALSAIQFAAVRMAEATPGCLLAAHRC